MAHQARGKRAQNSTHLRNGVFARLEHFTKRPINARAHGGKNETMRCERTFCGAPEALFSVRMPLAASRSLRRTRNTDTVPLQELPPALMAGASASGRAAPAHSRGADSTHATEERICAAHSPSGGCTRRQYQETASATNFNICFFPYLRIAQRRFRANKLLKQPRFLQASKWAYVS